MSISEEDVSGTEVIIQGDQGVEVQVLKSYGVGLDVHSQFIAVCVHVRNNNRVYKYMSDFDTDWNSLLAAKEWVVDTIKTRSAPVPDLSLPLHYVLEATSTYHMPVLRAWGGIPSVINPMLAGATKKKTDDLDAERLSFHDLTGVWPESFVASDDLSELRVLIAEATTTPNSPHNAATGSITSSSVLASPSDVVQALRRITR